MKIASILPYKENYTKQGAGAVALWISDFMRDSIYKRNTFVFGNTKNKNFLTKNYTNININNVNSRLNSTTKEYSSKIIKRIKTINFDIIELHNRPIMVKEFFKKIDSKIILYFHNDPTTMKGAKSIGERMYLLENVDKIIFISEWVKKRFFKDLPELSDNKTQVIYHSIDPVKVNVKKKKFIIFVGKLNESKGYDLYCKSMFNILNKNKDWKAYSIGEEKRFQNFPTHKRHLNLGQISHNKVLDFLSKSEIAVIPSRWEEPFGRTALEASSRGCATIISNRGGITETNLNSIILKKLSSTEIYKNGVKRQQIGMEIEGDSLKGPNTVFWQVFCDNKIVGKVTSAVFSPRLNRNIALAMVDKNFSKLGLNLLVKINGHMRKAKIVEKPFFDPKKSLPSS